MVNQPLERNLLPGLTAFGLLKLRFALTTSALCWLGLLGLLMILRIPQSWLTNCIVLVVFAHSLAVGVLIGWVSHKQRKERSAGYTTLRAEEKSLEQRDPYLGRQIRGPGQDYLSTDVLTDALHQAREESRRSSGYSKRKARNQ